MTSQQPNGSGSESTASSVQRVLNVGSGGRPNPQWTNLDIVGVLGLLRKLKTRSTTPNFVKHRLPKPLPFPDGRFEAIYCAQVVEHFNRADALKVLTEFHRILTTGGFARVIVPDLEAQAREYLDTLQRLRAEPSPSAVEDYEFAKIWMIEQFVRRTPGGELTTFVANASPAMKTRLRAEHSQANSAVAKLPAWLRHVLVVRTGQLHQWAYDSYDLTELARQAGFSKVNVVSATSSARADFVAFDNDDRGELQVGSLYLECFR